TAVNGTFGNVGANYSVVVEADEYGVYYLTADDIVGASPLNDRYELDGWTLNGKPCVEPGVGTEVKDGDYFVVTFSPEAASTTVSVSYEWKTRAPEGVNPPSTDFLTI